jgi:glutamate/tyrosine decarboxylase-like PLP-dependent enzyme
LATEIEKQTVAWLAGFIGVSPSYGGLLVSGGNMANFTGFLTGLRTKVPEYRKKGFSLGSAQYRVYCSKATHTWIDKAAGLFGLGTDSLAWIGTDSSNRMDLKSLGQAIRQDKMKGLTPVMVIGTAGDVSTGAVDDLRRIASICNKYDLWLHVDGAYGIPAAILPELKPLFDGIEEADSIALDPHKWLYSSLEAGCTLVKDPQHLTDTYSSHPAYYNFETAAGGAPHNYYEYGLQNSRGFRALKVWLMLQQSGRDGYINMIREDIRLSKLLYDMAAAHPELEAITQNLSVAVFRYVPLEWIPEDDKREDYLNKLNEALLNHLQSGGEVFLSNAMADERYCLRACIVNFRTTEDDIRAIMEIIVTEGRRIHNLQ